MNIWSIFGSIEVDGSQAVTELGNVRDQARRTGDALERDVAQKATRTSEQLKELGSGLRSLGLGLSAAITAPLTAIGVAGVKSATQLETFSNSLNVMIGDAEKAQALFDELYEFSATTPFEWTALTDATRQLVAFGVESEAVIPLMRQLGDVAAGLDTPIEDLAEIFGRVLVNGRMTMEEVNRLAERGVPIYTELARVLGVAESEIRSMVTDGSVNITHLAQVFENLTSEGGRFSGMMETLATTTAGKWATLKDNFSVVTDLVGERLLPVVNALLEWAADAVDWFVALDEGLQNNIITIGGVAAAIGPLLAGGGQLITMLAGSKGLTVALGALKGALAFLTGPTGVLLVIAGLITNEVVESFGGWEAVIQGVLGWLQKLWVDAQPAVEALGEVFSVVFTAITDLWTDALQPAIAGMAPLFERIFTAIAVVVEGSLDLVTGLLQGLAALLQGDFMGAWQAVRDGVVAAVQGLWDAVNAVFGDLIAAFAGFGKDVVDGFVNGLTGTFTKAKDAITGFGESIGGWFKEKLGIQSPSTVFYGYGVNLVEGLVAGIRAAAPMTEEALQELAATVTSAALRFLGLGAEEGAQENKWEGYGAAIAQGIIDGFERVIPGFETKFKAGVSAAKDFAAGHARAAYVAALEARIARGSEAMFGERTPRGRTVIQLNDTVQLAALEARIARASEAMFGERSPLGRTVLNLNDALQLAVQPFARLPGALQLGVTPRAGEIELTPIPAPDPRAGLPEARDLSSDPFSNVASDRSALPYEQLQAVLEAELTARQAVVDGLTTLSTEKGVLANFGAGLLDLVVSKVPLFGAALDGFVTAGPIGALIAVFTELLSRSEVFGLIMQRLNGILDPLLGAFDTLLKALWPIIEVAINLVSAALQPLAIIIEKVLAPVITFVARLIAGLYNAIASAINAVLGWLGVRLALIDLDNTAGPAKPAPGTPPPSGVVLYPTPTTPAPAPTPAPTVPRDDVSEREHERRLLAQSFASTAQTVQLAVATPLVEASRTFAEAAAGIEGVFSGLLGSDGGMGGLSEFNQAIFGITPLLERLLSEGVSINLNGDPVGARSRTATAYLRTGSVI